MGPCTKRKYTKEGADKALLDALIARELKGSNKRKEKRAYYHRPCKAWHITSMENNHGAIQGVQEISDRQASMDTPRAHNQESEDRREIQN